MLPSLEEFEQAALQGRIDKHCLYNMVGFKYTTNTVYSEDWDNVSLHARGIVFDKDSGKVLARPFDKFFNLGEMIDVETGELKPIAGYVKNHLGFDNLYGDYKHQKFRVMDKLDGSLGIAFWTGTDWFVKTAGSFESDQANWANGYFEYNINPAALDKSKTYLFEIIYDEDKHPISYDFVGMVLLGIIDTQTGIEEPLSEILRVAKELNIKHAEVLEFNDFDEVVKYAKNLPKTKEGVVITFENGFKLKVKGDEFLQLQKIFHYLNEKVIYDNLKWGTIFGYTELEYAYTDGFIMDIPEELEDLKEYANKLRKDFAFYLDLTEVYGRRIRELFADNRRAAYEHIADIATNIDKSGVIKHLTAAIMMYYTSGEINMKIRGAIYKAMKNIESL